MKKIPYTVEHAGDNVRVITDNREIIFNRVGNGEYTAVVGHLFARCMIPLSLKVYPPKLYKWEDIPEEQIQSALNYLIGNP